jgi:hypothetical protein
VRALRAGPRFAQEAPDALVKRVSQEVLQVIKTDPKVQAGDQARIRELIETKLAPNFDFLRMTSLAMGRNWAKATPTAEAARRRVQVAAGAHVLERADPVPQPGDRLQAAARPMRTRPRSTSAPRSSGPASRPCRSTTR